MQGAINVRRLAGGLPGSFRKNGENRQFSDKTHTVTKVMKVKHNMEQIV